MKVTKLYLIGAAIALTTITLPAVASESVTLDQLPAKVQATVRGQGGTDSIDKIKLETKNGQTVYEVEYAKKSAWRMRPELLVNSDGSIVKEKHMANTINEAAGANR